MSDIQSAIRTASLLSEALSKVIRGRSDTIDLVLCGLAARAHVLLEDYPGSGKTTLAKTLGGLISSEGKTNGNSQITAFRRIQFTPDLLPSDVLGLSVFEPKTATFRFQAGPIFAHIVLADEINRTGPKVQAAFLECMAEHQITIDNETHLLDELFFVIGTQNPLDMAGTYPLPLVQLDRFLLKIPMKYVDYETELEIVKEADTIEANAKNVQPVVAREQILQMQHAVKEITLSEPLYRAIVDIAQCTRDKPTLQFGASTRAAIMLKKALCAWALIRGRDYATEDDLKFIAPHVLSHRLKFHPTAGDREKAMEELLGPVLEKLVTSVWV